MYRRITRVYHVFGLGAAALVVGAGGCGANVQAVYEGDVRFEHCMALDATAEVKPQIRRACWREWIAFYTYGQTRDRVVHAQRRVALLSPGGHPNPPGLGASDFGSAELLVPTEAPAAACTGACQSVLDECARECSSHECHTSCTAGFRSCVRSCG